MKICVFCGSRLGNGQMPEVVALRVLIQRLGQWIGRQGFTLVYGGGKVGLMGLLADEVLAAKGQVVGIIPDFMMTEEVAHPGLTDLQIVKSMHERKVAMLAQSDVFLCLPGGFGTLDELFEALTLSQLRLLPDGRRQSAGEKQKPVLILNEKFFFQPLLEELAVMERWGFLSAEHRAALEVLSNEAALYQRLRALA